MQKPKTALAARIREARGDKSQEDVAYLVGISTESVSAYETGKTIPRPPILRALSDALNVSEEWLRRGKDEIKPAEENPQLETLYAKNTFYVLKEGIEVLEHVAVPLMVGEAALLKPPKARKKGDADIPIPRRFLPDPEMCFALYVEGDSMAPLIKSRTIVIVDRANPDPYRLLGKVVVVRIGNTIMVSRLMKEDDEFYVMADNPVYTVQSVILNFRNGNAILGRVVCVVR